MAEKDLEYWKNNCEEEYRNTPICVLRYITELENSIEFANQQPEVDHECKYCGAMTTEPDEYCYRNPNSKDKQPEQDKVREAAESAFNQARKQTSMLGEKDVQMTDYLISPKYKTFDDYWNSKKQ